MLCFVGIEAEVAADPADRQTLAWTGLICLLRSLASPSFVFFFYRFAYRPILKMLEERRQQIAQGMANAEQIKTELAKTETQRQEVMAEGKRSGNKLIEEARTQPPATGAGNAKGHSCCRTDHEPGLVRPPTRTTLECSPNSSARWAGWLFRPLLRLSERYLTPEDQKRLCRRSG